MTTTSMGGAPGAGGAQGAGGATQAGTGGNTGPGVDAAPEVRLDATSSMDAVVAVDAPVANNGSYVRTGWTATYTCTGTCLAGNGNAPNDMPPNAFDPYWKAKLHPFNHVEAGEVLGAGLDVRGVEMAAGGPVDGVDP